MATGIQKPGAGRGSRDAGAFIDLNPAVSETATCGPLDLGGSTSE
jgi:hypothetical protein